MIIMPADNTGHVVRALFEKHPGKLALLMSPSGFRPHRFQFPYAIDNGAFKSFDEKKFFEMLDFSKQHNPPMFVVCPDVVGCHSRTLALWHYYQPRLIRYGYKIAFVAQDGCNPEDIPNNADWIFIGGLDPWKIDNIHKFVGNGKPVHVGRVNGMGRLKYCESLGVDSIDGTGWMRFRNKNFYDLIDYLNGDEKQLKLFA